MTGGLRLALGLFTVAPVKVTGDVDRPQASTALLWLPVVGVVLGAVAAVPVIVLDGRAGFVGAVLTVVLLALLTRGLHLDGLADLVDGLGSRQPAEAALAIMRRSDIGAFGVAALLLNLLLDVSALTTLAGAQSRWPVFVAVVLMVSTGRMATLWAAGPPVPAARPDGFGALVAGSVSASKQILATIALVLVTTAVGVADHDYVRLLVAEALGLLAAWVVRVHAVHRLGGVTGDVFGALIEVATTVSLVAVAIEATWR